MSLNQYINRLYSSNRSIIQYREILTTRIDPIYQVSFKKGSLYIEIPDIQDIIIISNINSNANYEIIADENIINDNNILLTRYKKVVIRIFDIKDYDTFYISFDVTLAKKSIRSCL